ncbi:MAG: ADOP family duplicated permease [Cyanobacteria bacterium]|nr:ADOP family duplicated permease [Cyanobacteriota bacterium]
MSVVRAFGAAARNLRRARSFTALVILTRALGIGATTAMFSVVDTVVLNPLPVPNADRIIEVWTFFQEGAGRAPGATSAVISTLRTEAGLFEAVGAYQFGAGTITGAGEPEVVSVAGLAPSVFSVFPAAPLLGRLFNDNDVASTQPAILISERMWATRFGRDPGVIERVLTIDDLPHRIVGVLPARFTVPESSVSVWRPIDVESANARLRVQLVGVMRPGVTRAAVDDRLKVLTVSLQESGALPKGQYLVTDVPVQVGAARSGAKALYLLLGAVGVLLLVACVNITNLILVRASSRRSELALMAALGAGRARLLRDAAIESALLAVIGGALGVWLAGGVLRLILGLAPDSLLMLSSATGELHPRAVVFAIAVTFITCVLFSVLPAWRASRVDPVDALKQQSRSSQRDDHWWQGVLVSTQIALAVVLLAGAGLLLRSFVKLNQVDLGFQADGLVLLDIQMPPKYRKGGAARAFMRDVERRIESALGTPATIVSASPVRRGGYSSGVRPEVEGLPAPARSISLPSSRVSADFFEVAGIPLLEGRTFIPEDGEDAIIINDVLARMYFGNTSPIGRRFKTNATQPWLTVVGVAADIKTMGPADAIGEGTEVYLPMGATGDSNFLTLMARADGREAVALQELRRSVWDIDPNMPILEARTMAEVFGDSIARPKFLASLSGAFTICAVVIAAVGVYGVAAYWVARRRRELAIRLAVGASPDRLILAVIGRSLRLTAIGTIAGLAIAAAGGRIMTTLLFATDPHDPVTFAVIIVLLGAIAIAACLVPALRAARVDPMTTLRAE